MMRLFARHWHTGMHISPSQFLQGAAIHAFMREVETTMMIVVEDRCDCFIGHREAYLR